MRFAYEENFLTNRRWNSSAHRLKNPLGSYLLKYVPLIVSLYNHAAPAMIVERFNNVLNSSAAIDKITYNALDTLFTHHPPVKSLYIGARALSFIVAKFLPILTVTLVSNLSSPYNSGSTRAVYCSDALHYKVYFEPLISECVCSCCSTQH